MICKICSTELHDAACMTVKELKHGTHARFEYFQCAACGCIQIVDFPLDISKYYEFEHGSLIEDKPLSLRDGISKLFHVKKYIFYVYAILRFQILGRIVFRFFPYQPVRVLLGMAKNISILDVGCNAGVLLYGLKTAGYANVTGVDPFIKDDVIEYSNGVCIKKKAIEELTGTDMYDVIMFHHSFEHIPCQLETLKAAHRLLKKNGICLLRIPALSDYMMDHYGTFWVHWDAPRHYFLHSRKSIGISADQAGFRVERIIDESKFTSLLWSELYKKGLTLGATFRYLLNPLNTNRIFGFMRKTAALNRLQDADCLAVYLRK